METEHAHWGTDPSGYCGCKECNAPDDTGAGSEARGLRFRVETACDGYANLMSSDVPEDVFDPDDYTRGARAAAEGIRSIL